MEKFDSTAEEKNTTTAISQFLSFLLLRNKKINDAYPKMVLARTNFSHDRHIKTKDGPGARPFSIAVDGVGYGLGGPDNLVARIKRSEVASENCAVPTQSARYGNIIDKIEIT